MRKVILSLSFADTFRATLTSGLLVLGSLVVLQTQLINLASAEVTFLNKWGSSGTLSVIPEPATLTLLTVGTLLTCGRRWAQRG